MLDVNNLARLSQGNYVDFGRIPARVHKLHAPIDLFSVCKEWKQVVRSNETLWCHYCYQLNQGAAVIRSYIHIKEKQYHQQQQQQLEVK